MNPFLRLAVIVGALPVTLTNGTTADATQVMSDLNWLVNQVNANAAPLASTALVNANNNFTTVQSGIAASAPANFPIASQIQSSVFNTFQSTLGTNALTARMAALSLTAWPTDGIFTFVPSQTNTGPSNITVDSAGSSILFSMGSTLVGGELRLGVPAHIERDATKLNLLNPSNVRFDLSSSATGTGVRVLVSSTPRPVAIGKQPSRQVLTGSGTYSTPTGCVRINVRMVGGGGSGAGSGAAVVNGTAGGNTTFGPLTAGGGGAGTSSGGAGGTNSGSNQITTPGGAGGGSSNHLIAGQGGSSFFGGEGGASGASGGNTTAAGFGGGGGGGTNADGSQTGGGGGGGGYIEHQFIYPDASYSFGVGAGQTGGVGTVSTGGTSAAGTIIVDEFYN